MPTLRKRINPWHARAKRDGIEYSLGYFETEQEAKEQRINGMRYILARKTSTNESYNRTS